MARWRPAGFRVAVANANCYEPRRPEQTLLYAVIARQLETFLARRREQDRELPRFVEEEFRAFLDCGILARGFLRLRCGSCGKDRVVAFSCRRRGVCSSCGGKRMAATAAHLMDRVFPDVPVRQWVLSLSFAARYRLAFDASLLRAASHLFARSVFGWLRARARDRGIFRSQCGAVTFVQRFSSDLRLNPHFHMMVIEGAYTATGSVGGPASGKEAEKRCTDRTGGWARRYKDAPPEFHELPPPNDSDVADVVCDAARRIENLLARSGATEDPAEADPLIRDNPALGGLAAASVLGKTTTGKRQTTLGIRIDPEALDIRSMSRCASVAGYSLHADTSIPAGARGQLERLLRYAGRPALAEERLSELPDGRLVYRLKRPWRDGTSSVVFEPGDLMARLAAIVPPPRAHAIHYYSIFAPGAAYRSAIVPGSVMDPAVVPVPETTEAAEATQRAVTRPRNYSWSCLMARVFAVDVLICPACGGPMKIIAAITQPEIARRILDCLGLPSRAPPLSPARQQAG